MIKKLDLTEKAVANIVGKMFRVASERLEIDEEDFCRIWLKSELCQRLYEMDETLICQSKIYLFNSLVMENDLPEKKGHRMDAEAMDWVGYILTYWMYLREIPGKLIEEKYDICKILQEYDTLHTVSCKVAIDMLEQDDIRGI